MEREEEANNLSKIRRYELKYVINESLAAEIRDYISSICTLDKHVPPGETGYIVNNLYFDTGDLRFYHDTKHRKLTRYKPRARFYGEKASDFIWPEIKFRNANVIWKRRYSIPIDQWPGLFSPSKTNHASPTFKNEFEKFDEVVYWHNAQPVLHVRYFREPYVTELETYGRITFDRRLCCRPTDGSIDLEYDERDMLYYDDPITAKSDDSPLLLEIKVETHVPAWVISLIHTFNLMQRPYSKYCYGIDSLFHNCDNGRIANFPL